MRHQVLLEQREVGIDVEEGELAGTLTVPPDARGVVVFAHGSGSSRHSSRNQYVAAVLQQSGLATLLMDLLTPEEEAIDLRTAHLRFNIELLAGRVADAADWVHELDELNSLAIGVFGASTGGGAALVAAAERPERIRAVVSRGGRPDLAGAALPQVEAATLLIVGGDDVPVIAMNEDARRRMQAPVELRIVPGASHLFEEPGTLEQVASLARDWFLQKLSRTKP